VEKTAPVLVAEEPVKAEVTPETADVPQTAIDDSVEACEAKAD